MLTAETETRLEKYSRKNVLPRRDIIHERCVRIGGAKKQVAFSVIQDDRKREAARDLLNDRYGRRGYGSAHDLYSDMSRVTFAAEIDEQVVGTMTLAVDSDHGLAIDRTFSDVTAQVRQEPGMGLCELTKLAFQDSLRSQEVLAGLFHMAFIYGTTYTRCTDLFIEVNPRHVRFYEQMLGFHGVGVMRDNASVGAPSQLMRLQVDAIKNNIREFACAPSSAHTRSLYPHFFSAEEEQHVRRSLVNRSASTERLTRLLDSVNELLSRDMAAITKGSRPNGARMLSAA